MSTALADRQVQPSHRRTLLRYLGFPTAVVMLVLTLGLLRVNGSSLSLYATGVGVQAEDAGVLAGPARPIRSDEWYVRTPWALRQKVLGLADRVEGGVGTHDVAVLSDLPTGGWETVLRPHTASYRVLDANRAFAVEWWTFLAVQMVGVYTLMAALTRRPTISALTALLLGLSPATQWWYSPGTFTTIGYGSAAAGLFLFATRLPGWPRAAAAVGSGLSFAAFLTTLYVPWQIGTALVVGPITVGALGQQLLEPAKRRDAIRSMVVPGLVAGGIGSILFALFILDHRPTIDAIVGTVYPGTEPARRGGGVNLVTFWGSPFDSYSASSTTGVVNAANQSENAAGLVLLWPVAVAFCLLASGSQLMRTRLWYPLVGLLAGGALIVSWMLLPIPASIGQLALLTRAAPQRFHLPLALAGVLALGVFAAYRAEAGVQVPPFVKLLASSAFAATSMWAAGGYLADNAPPSLRSAGLLVLVVCVGIALALSTRPATGLVVLVAFSAWQTSLINPLQVGTGPLTASPLRSAIDRVQADGRPTAGWATFDVDPIVKGTLTASGVDHLTGVSPYPDVRTWRLLDPTGASESIWNRYAHISLSVGATGSPPVFELLGPDSLKVTVDPCGPEIRQLDVQYFVSMEGGPAISCAVPVADVVHGAGRISIQRRADT